MRNSFFTLLFLGLLLLGTRSSAVDTAAVKAELLERSKTLSSFICDTKMEMTYKDADLTAQIETVGAIEYLRGPDGSDLYRSDVYITTRVKGEEAVQQRQLTVSNGSQTHVVTESAEGREEVTVPTDASSAPQLVGVGFWRQLETEFSVKEIESRTIEGDEVYVMLADAKSADSADSSLGPIKSVRFILDRKSSLVTKMEYLDDAGKVFGVMVFEHYQLNPKLDVMRFKIDAKQPSAAEPTKSP